LETFFPSVIAAKERASAQTSSPYCQFDDMILQLWTSSMFLAGAFAGKTSQFLSEVQISTSQRTWLPAWLIIFQMCKTQPRPNIYIPGIENANSFLDTSICNLQASTICLCDQLERIISLIFAGIATIIFKPFFQRIGRKGVMISGGVAFVIGAALQAGALNMGMLIIGRLFLGLGIGFANQVGVSTPPPSFTS
jgi:hypothetical protein